jgi:hypothetical protein
MGLSKVSFYFYIVAVSVACETHRQKLCAEDRGGRARGVGSEAVIDPGRSHRRTSIGRAEASLATVAGQVIALFAKIIVLMAAMSVARHHHHHGHHFDGRADF